LGNAKKVSVDLVQESDNEDVLSTFALLRSLSNVGLVNIHRTIANSPKVFPRFIGLAHALRNDTNLDPAERELAICCVLERHHGLYELAPHRRLGVRAGLTEAQLANACNPDASAELYTERQRAILRFAERFAADPAERDALPDDNIEMYLDNRQRIELALTLALYVGLAHFTGVLAVPHDWAP
jgi:alkylhydroperoxidase family enzyme